MNLLLLRNHHNPTINCIADEEGRVMMGGTVAVWHSAAALWSCPQKHILQHPAKSMALLEL
jgi:hypothetical protein